MVKKLTPEQVGKKYGFRSGLEEKISKQLESLNVSYRYEAEALPFVQPEKNRKYTPDFFIYDEEDNLKLIIESKGRFTVADRQKMLWIKKQYPDSDIRMVFSNSKTKISKGSKTTYGMWCEKNGFIYADKLIPREWLDLLPTEWI